eukprot:1194563-Prorocentrum_minimum.AAC.10
MSLERKEDKEEKKEIAYEKLEEGGSDTKGGKAKTEESEPVEEIIEEGLEDAKEVEDIEENGGKGAGNLEVKGNMADEGK